jgi:hypothetical protein
MVDKFIMDNDIWCTFLLLLILLLTPVIVMGASDANSMTEHIDVVTWVIGGLFVIISFLIVRLLRKIDGSQNVLFERMNTLCEKFYTLQGEHNAMMGECAEHNRRKDDIR